MAESDLPTGSSDEGDLSAAPAAGVQSPDTGAAEAGALAWVQESLRQSLDAAQKAVRRFVKESQAIAGDDIGAIDPGVLHPARQQLHQAGNVLDLIGLPAAAHVLRAAASALAPQAGRPPPRADTADAVEQAVRAVLEDVALRIAGRPVSPLALYPAYRAVQATAGAARAHPADLWPLAWRWRTLPDDPSLAPLAPDERARQAIEAGLLALLKQPPGSPAFEAASGAFGTLCARLGAGAAAGGRPHAATLWKLAAAVFEAQALGLIRPDLHVKRVASALLAQLRRLARETGDLDDDASAQLARDLLFFCAQATPAVPGLRAAPRLEAVRQVWQLEGDVPVDYENSPLARTEPAQVAQAKKRLQAASAAWDAAVTGEMQRASSLAETFSLAGESMKRLYPGGVRLAGTLQSSVVRLSMLPPGTMAPAVAMEVAGALLYLDAALDDGTFDHPAQRPRLLRLAERIEAVQNGADALPPEPWVAKLVQRVADRQTYGSVVHELRVSLAEAETLLDRHLRDPAAGTAATLPEAVKALQGMHGVFVALGIEAAAQAVLRLKDDVAALAAAGAGGARPAAPSGDADADRLDRLTVNLGMLGLLIDLIGVQPEQARSLFIFDPARGTLDAPSGWPGAAGAARAGGAAADLPGVRPDRGEAPSAREGALLPPAPGTRRADADADDAPLVAADGEPDPRQGAAADPRPVGSGAVAPASGTSAMPREQVAADVPLDADTLSAFLEEAAERIDDARSALAETGADVSKTLTQLQRTFHTLRGGARAAGLDALADAAQRAESVCDARPGGRVPPDAALRAFAGRALDAFDAWIIALASGRRLDPVAGAELAAAHDALAAAAPDARAAASVAPQPGNGSLLLPAPDDGDAGAATARLGAGRPGKASGPPAPAGMAGDTTSLSTPGDADGASEPAGPDGEDDADGPRSAYARGASAPAFAPLGLPPNLPSAADLELGPPSRPATPLPARPLVPSSFPTVPVLSAPPAPTVAPLPVPEAMDSGLSVEDFEALLPPAPGPASRTDMPPAGVSADPFEGFELRLPPAPSAPSAAVPAAQELPALDVDLTDLDFGFDVAFEAMPEVGTDGVPVPARSSDAGAPAVEPAAPPAAVGPFGGRATGVAAGLPPTVPATAPGAALGEAGTDGGAAVATPMASPAAGLGPTPLQTSAAGGAVSMRSLPSPAGPPGAAEASPDPEDDLDAADLPDAELFGFFAEEAHELLPRLGAELRAWAAQPDDASPPAAAMRTLHTLKGSARLAGAMRLGERCHRLETRIERLLAHPPVEAADVEALHARADALAAAFDALRAARLATQGDAAGALSAASEAIGGAHAGTGIETGTTPDSDSDAGTGTGTGAEGGADDGPGPGAVSDTDAAIGEGDRTGATAAPATGAAAGRAPDAAEGPKPDAAAIIPAPVASGMSGPPQPGAAPRPPAPVPVAATAVLAPAVPSTPRPPEPSIAPLPPVPVPAAAAMPFAPAAPWSSGFSPASLPPVALAAAAPAARADGTAEAIQPPAPLSAPTATPAAVSRSAVPDDGDAIDWSRFAADTTQTPRPAPDGAASPAALPSTVRVRTPLLDRLLDQAAEVGMARARIEGDVRRIKATLGDLTDNLDRLRAQLRELELQAELSPGSRQEAAQAAGQAFDPLELDRYNRLQELTRMMAESVGDVATVQRTLQRAVEGSEDGLAAQARLARDLQTDLLRTRMVEFESLAERFYRVVRQAAKDTGRQVRLDLVGGSIELDRGVLDRMTPAFEHLLRNAVVHGIEPPEVRRAAGKPVAGRIVVAAGHAGNEVQVEVRDDGAGLDFARIRQRAVAAGRLAEDARPTESDLAALVFEPGFSTADRVTEFAGRGVGMDVVRNEVAAMGGRIETASRSGEGTRFTLVLPLTTAVTQVTVLRCGAATVAVPAPLVESAHRPAPAGEALRQALAGGTWRDGDATLPLFSLGALLGQTPPRDDDAPFAGDPESDDAPAVIVVRSAQQRVALYVDAVGGRQEAVVKPLGPQLSRVPGLVGMTLLPSGDPAPIYNPVALAAVHGAAARAGRLRDAADDAPTLAPLVLVVDDSLTVRRVTQRLLEREGWRVALAKDGLDALDRIAEEKPAVVLSDIEMPHLDGFDLVRRLREAPALRDLPVIVITSRIAAKHREVAAGLGVAHYLGKPYAQDELVALIRRCIEEEAGRR